MARRATPTWRTRSSARPRRSSPRKLAHYARALAFAAEKGTAAARREIDAIALLEKEADFTAYTDWGVPGKEMVRTARLVASARLADAQGDLASAANAYEEAVAVEDAPASREPPYWYDPIRQLLGSVYPRQGTLDAAEKALHDSLARQACTQAWRGGAAPDILRLSAAGPAGCKRDA